MPNFRRPLMEVTASQQNVQARKEIHKQDIADGSNDKLPRGHVQLLRLVYEGQREIQPAAHAGHNGKTQRSKKPSAQQPPSHVHHPVISTAFLHLLPLSSPPAPQQPLSSTTSPPQSLPHVPSTHDLEPPNASPPINWSEIMGSTYQGGQVVLTDLSADTTTDVDMDMTGISMFAWRHGEAKITEVDHALHWLHHLGPGPAARSLVHELAVNSLAQMATQPLKGFETTSGEMRRQSLHMWQSYVIEKLFPFQPGNISMPHLLRQLGPADLTELPDHPSQSPPDIAYSLTGAVFLTAGKEKVKEICFGRSKSSAPHLSVFITTSTTSAEIEERGMHAQHWGEYFLRRRLSEWCNASGLVLELKRAHEADTEVATSILRGKSQGPFTQTASSAMRTNPRGSNTQTASSAMRTNPQGANTQTPSSALRTKSQGVFELKVVRTTADAKYPPMVNRNKNNLLDTAPRNYCILIEDKTFYVWRFEAILSQADRSITYQGYHCDMFRQHLLLHDEDWELLRQDITGIQLASAFHVGNLALAAKFRWPSPKEPSPDDVGPEGDAPKEGGDAVPKDDSDVAQKQPTQLDRLAPAHWESALVEVEF